MFTVYLYSFSKAENSTARPAQAGLEFSCQIKAPFSVLSPELTFINNDAAAWNPTTYNYAYLPAFHRYYFINDWTNAGPAWTASLIVDPLSSYRDTIGAFSTYVYRSSYAYNGLIKDNQYPCKAEVVEYVNPSVPSPFAVAEAEDPSSDIDFWVLVEIQGVVTQHIVMSMVSFVRLLNELFSDRYYEAVLGEFGATEYPEAKVAINPLQYITKAKFVIGDRVRAFVGNGSAPKTSLWVGPAEIPASAGVEYWLCGFAQSMSYTISQLVHPQSFTRGAWLNSDPSTAAYDLYIAPFGIIHLPAQDVGVHDRLGLTFNVDAWTANVTLTVTAFNAEHPSEDVVLTMVTSPIGMDLMYSGMLSMIPGENTAFNDFIPVGQALLGTISSAGSAIFNTLTLKSGLVAGAASVESNALNMMRATHELRGKWTSYLVPHTSIGGTQGGSFCNSVAGSYLMCRFQLLVDEDLNDFGRPLMEVRTLGTLPGYIECNPEGFSISGLPAELEAITSYMQGGFYYV